MTKPWRSKKYREWVSTLPCCMCGAPGPSDPHHIKGAGHYGGVGLKAPDYTCMPMCRECHNFLHRGHAITLDRQWDGLAKTLAMAVERGVLVMKRG